MLDKFSDCRLLGIKGSGSAALLASYPAFGLTPISPVCRRQARFQERHDSIERRFNLVLWKIVWQEIHINFRALAFVKLSGICRTTGETR